MPISGFFIIKNLSNDNVKFICKRTVFYMLILVLVNFSVYSVEYKSIITILNFCAMVICYKSIFKIDMFSSLLMSTILMIIIFLSEMFTYVIIIEPIFNQWQLRNYGISLLLANIAVSIIAILLSRIKFFKDVASFFSSKFKKSVKLQTILIAILWLLVISILGFIIFTASANSFSLWISIFVEGVFIIFMINYIKDKNKYVALNEKFDILYDYIQTIEDYIDSEQFNIHEHNNQLCVIRSMTSNKKIISYIDSLIVNTSINSFYWNSELKKLPKGGIKGLIYYKLALANTNGINVMLNISNDCSNKIKKLSTDDIKQISRILGVYLDNSIEACMVSIQKSLCLEIYVINSKLNFVISNSFSGNIDIQKINKKGYTSKGKNRGKGLYFVSKLLSKNDNFKSYTNVTNNYFVQKLVIN